MDTDAPKGMKNTDLGGTPLAFTDITITNVLGNNALKNITVTALAFP